MSDSKSFIRYMSNTLSVYGNIQIEKNEGKKMLLTLGIIERVNK